MTNSNAIFILLHPAKTLPTWATNWKLSSATGPEVTKQKLLFIEAEAENHYTQAYMLL